MKIARVAEFYPEAIRQQSLSDVRTSEELFNKIINSRIGLSDFITSSLVRHGFQAKEFIYNNELYNKLRNKELKSNYDSFKLLIEDLKEFLPDVLILNIEYRNNLNVEIIRKEVPTIKKIFGWRCVETDASRLEILKKFDTVFTCTPGFCDYFNKNGINSKLMPFGYSNNLDFIKVKNYKDRLIDVNVSGSLVIGKNLHGERIKLLTDLASNIDNIKIYSDKTFGISPKKKFFFDTKLMLSKYQIPFLDLNLEDDFNTYKLISPIVAKISSPVFGVDMYNTMSDSKIIINKHIDSAGEYAGNMRMFEATSMGACLLTDRKKNLSEIFIEDKEVVAYSSVEECVGKVKWLLGNPEKAEEIAINGMNKTRKLYNYDYRVKAIINELSSSRFFGNNEVV